MKKQDWVDYLNENDYNVKKAMAFIEKAIADNQSSWQVLELECCFGPTKVKHTPYGYRKNTTGEYVPNAYRRNFGWKNTFYQAAKLEINLSIRDFGNRYVNPKLTEFNNLEFKKARYGIQAKLTFDNGYGVSVLCGNQFYYSNGKDTYEIAILKDGDLCYGTAITDDVLGHQTAEEIDKVIKQVKTLNTPDRYNSDTTQAVYIQDAHCYGSGSDRYKGVSGITKKVMGKIDTLLAEKGLDRIAILVDSHTEHSGQKYKRAILQPGYGWNHRQINDADFNIIAEI